MQVNLHRKAIMPNNNHCSWSRSGHTAALIVDHSFQYVQCISTVYNQASRDPLYEGVLLCFECYYLDVCWLTQTGTWKWKGEGKGTVSFFFTLLLRDARACPGCGMSYEMGLFLLQVLLGISSTLHHGAKQTVFWNTLVQHQQLSMVLNIDCHI